MKNNTTLLVFLLPLCMPIPVSAKEVESTTSTFISARNCVAGKSGCDSIGPALVREIGGVTGGNEAEGELSDPELGEVQARAVLSGQPGSGKLSGFARSIPGKRNGANAILVQRYTNNSETAQTFTATGAVTYEQQVPEANADFPAGDGGGHTNVTAELSLFRRDGLFEAGPSPEENWAMIMDGEMPPGFQSLGDAKNETTPSNVTATGSEPLSLSTRVEPGGSVWVFALLQAISANGAVAKGEFESRFEISPE